MDDSSLLATLAFKFATHPENLATEALLHILRRTAACEAFTKLANELAPGCISSRLNFRTQAAGADDAIPDLAALASDGEEVVLVENKFWAGLTSAQPVGYLARLEGRPRGLLLFVAPAKRVRTLWPELIKRCRDSGATITEAAASEERRTAAVDGDRVLALVSWRWLLGRLRLGAADSNDRIALGDIEQLNGLCEAMDTEAFLPLTSEELTGALARRVTQYCELVDDLAHDLIRAGHANKQGLRAAAGSGWYGQYLRIHGYECLLAFSATRWAEFGLTPIWLRVATPELKRNRTILDDLRRSIPELVVHNSEYGAVTPIRLGTGVERGEVLNGALEQLLRVVQFLAENPRSTSEAEERPDLSASDQISLGSVV